MPDITITAALVAAATTAIGWCVAQVFSWYKDSTVRELALRLKVVERQIEEFYGPLFSLTSQIEDAREIRDRLRKAYIAAFKRGIEWDQAKANWKTTDDERKTWPIPEEEIDAVTEDEIQDYRNILPISTMRYYGLEAFVYPLYEQANKVLSNKLHLVNRHELPQSYREFMRHALMHRFQNRLFIDKKVPSNFTRSVEYPKQFTKDVAHDLQKLRREYELLQGQVTQATKWRSAAFSWRIATTGPTNSIPN